MYMNHGLDWKRYHELLFKTLVILWQHLCIFSDYQEMIEDIIYNLMNNLDVQETNRMIADYKEANKNFISKNRQKQNRELLELEDILSEERKQNFARRQMDVQLNLVI